MIKATDFKFKFYNPTPYEYFGKSTPRFNVDSSHYEISVVDPTSNTEFTALTKVVEYSFTHALGGYIVLSVDPSNQTDILHGLMYEGGDDYIIKIQHCRNIYYKSLPVRLNNAKIISMDYEKIFNTVVGEVRITISYTDFLI